MAREDGAGDLLGRVVGGYRLERLLSASGGRSVYAGRRVESAFADAGLPEQAQVTVYPLAATQPPEAQAEVRARFQREVEEAQRGTAGGALVSGEDSITGARYLVTPLPAAATGAFATGAFATGAFAAPPPPPYGWYGGGAPGTPVYPQGGYAIGPSPFEQPARSSVGRIVVAFAVTLGICALVSTLAVGAAAFYSLTRFTRYDISINHGPDAQVKTGCAASASVESGLALPAGAAPDNRQVLRIEEPGVTDVQSIDPPDASSFMEAQYAALVFPGLLTLDRNQCAIPWAARALPDVSQDGLVYTFHLRPNLRWSDGVPITAQTFAYSINRAEDPCYGFSAAYYLNAIQDAADFNSETCDYWSNTVKGSIKTLIGDSLLAPDPLTLRVTLANPSASFLTAFAYPASYAVPEQLVKPYGVRFPEYLSQDGGFGGGLFKVVSWDPTGGLRLARNDSFWGAKPLLREIDVTFNPDEAAAYQDYLAGKSAVGFAPDTLLARARGHTGFHQIPKQEIYYYAMNWQKAPFDDLGMRQAFAVALDKTALAALAGPGGSERPTNHITPESMAGYDAGLKGPDGTQSLRGNLALARRLATAYATKKGCGTASDFSTCPAVTLTVLADSSQVAVANAARAMWLKAIPGYPIHIQALVWDSYTSAIGAGAQFAESYWTADYPDPQDIISNNLECGGGFNDQNACDHSADQLLLTADAASDPTARLAGYQMAEQILVTQVGWVPLTQSTDWWEARATVHNYALSPTGVISPDVWRMIYLTPR
ncbi:MAG TPA: peptide ABC transporter substrate-binding protein [Ktedonobacterales bacterium]